MKKTEFCGYNNRNYTSYYTIDNSHVDKLEKALCSGGFSEHSHETHELIGVEVY
jgi:hypothetical protein